ncbi:MAG: 5-formyltetrahydrofolate cyclo-ligase [Gammaproteobacteria bacterium]|nr:5-formyltetrahydrofolate cyclo-ligase [Gammaproteobacteria bacterium]
MTAANGRRQQLRERLRQERRGLASNTRTWAAAEMCRRVTELEQFAAAKNIAAYFPFDGEIDTAPLIAAAGAAGKTVYLPVVKPGATLVFAPCTNDTALTPNRYGIAEPVCPGNEQVAADQLALILLPLVAFDYSLHRLGMGAGYYDRTLAPLCDRPIRPYLLGIGYDLQCVDTVFPQGWDVAADAVITEACTYTNRDGQQ